MRVYRTPVFRGSPAQLERLITEIEKRLDNGWARETAREPQVFSDRIGRLYCFSCRQMSDLPACELWAVRSEDVLRISNVLADEELSSERYNAVVEEFCERFAVPSAKSVGAQVDLGKADLQIEEFLSAPTAELLRSFSGRANRSVLHPKDRERWNKFLAAAHREASQLSSDVLKRWLVEEEKWPEDEAVTLADEYENARDLLSVYESHAS